MNMKKVTLYSSTKKKKGELVIVPPVVVGKSYYHHTGRLKSVVHHHHCHPQYFAEVEGGRSRLVICLHPSHYDGKQVEMYLLTTPETQGLMSQLKDDFEKYVLPASVHDAWKVKKNQGCVLAIKEERCL